MAYDIMGADDILGAEDILGADDLMGADELLGAARRRRNIARAPSLFNKVPGVSPPALAKLPLGFPFLAFEDNGSGSWQYSVSGSAAVAGQSATVTTRPQVPVIPRRLVCNVVKSTAAAAYGVLITNVRVGTKSIFASANGIDAQTFAATAFGVELTAESAQPGIDITIDFTIYGPSGAVPASSDIAVTAQFICDSVI